MPVTARPDRQRPPRRPGPAPRDRPPLALRALIGLVGVAAALSTVALLLADRAPRLLESVFGDRTRALWDRVDASERVALPAGSDLPPTDFLVHVAIWAVVSALGALAIWSWRGLVLSAALLAIASVGLELAQGRYSRTRAVEFDDAVANLLGIAAGTLAAGACFVAWSLVAIAVRRIRS